MKYLVLLMSPIALAFTLQKASHLEHNDTVVNTENAVTCAESILPLEEQVDQMQWNEDAKAQDQGEKVEHMVLIRAERMPAWPGCEVLINAQVKHCTNEMLTDYIASNTIYPTQAKYQDIKGTVYVYYEVNTKGEVVNTRIERKAHALLNKEALRVINSLPAHEAGMQNGKEVRVAYTVPVHFPPKH